MSFDSPPPRLEAAAGLVSLFTLLFTAAHLAAGRVYRGHRRGRAITLLPSVAPAFLSAFLLALSLLALLALYLYRLFAHPPFVGSKSELPLVAAAAAALCWTGVIGANRRRRAVAAKLASIPCFGNGDHAASHQVLPPLKSTMLAFSPLFVAPAPTAVRSSSGATLRDTEVSTSNESTPEKKARRSSTAGITKRRIWEFSCRTASTWVFGRPKRQAWPLNVVRTYRTKGKRFVLIKDETVQDGAGAVLLDPAFTHSYDLDKAFIARVVFEALNRATLCVLHSWNKRFEGKLFAKFAQLPAIVLMMTGDLRKSVGRKKFGASHEAQQACYLTEIMWAIVVVEVLDYLQFKRNDLPFLSWLVQLPQWLCQYDASGIEAKVDSVFKSWMAGRRCGKSLFRPCDSECCCHNTAPRNMCGCLCPCVCTCV